MGRKWVVNVLKMFVKGRKASQNRFIYTLNSRPSLPSSLRSRACQRESTGHSIAEHERICLVVESAVGIPTAYGQCPLRQRLFFHPSQPRHMARSIHPSRAFGGVGSFEL